MAVTRDAFFIAERACKRLAQGNADIFHRVMGIDFQIAFGVDFQIDQAVPGDLIQHVIEKRNARGKQGFTGAVQVDFDADLSFERISLYLGRTLNHVDIRW